MSVGLISVVGHESLGWAERIIKGRKRSWAEKGPSWVLIVKTNQPVLPGLSFSNSSYSELNPTPVAFSHFVNFLRCCGFL